VAAGTDAFGRALWEWARGSTEPETIERDDGFAEVGAGHELYVAAFGDWPAAERRSVRYVRGRVVDVGCGAGRVALYLQERGFEVVGLDASPLAARTARARGVRETWCMSIGEFGRQVAGFDTVVLFGNNFGIFGTPERLRRALAAWARRCAPGTRILAESTNPYCGGAPALDRGYYHRNRQRGRLGGQVRLRTRYRGAATPWFDWLFVSRREMGALVRGTGWHPRLVVGAGRAEPYVAVLERQ